ncbi:unnamed protein product, partial [Oppiella nova]
YEGRDLDVFLGIPYAQPPIGDLRFKKPLPLDRKWEQPLDAQHWPPACYHNKYHQDYFNHNMSEDCLYLNIWSPVNTKSTGALKPVMFWIHGGGFVWGSSVEKFYSGEVLSALGDVVVVTINYRLNIFGLLYTGAEGPAPGNMALWDQSVALEWVVDNIRYFGGDPQRVTIFGESAGAFSVAAHILSPISRNLFTNAILMSGAPLNDRLITPRDEREREGVEKAVSLGCGVSTDGKFTPELIDCLMGQPPEKLVQEFTLDVESSVIDIIVDGEFLPESPKEMLKSGNFKKGL